MVVMLGKGIIIIGVMGLPLKGIAHFKSDLS
jgi:hypothetical protein